MFPFSELKGNFKDAPKWKFLSETENKESNVKNRNTEKNGYVYKNHSICGYNVF